MLAAAVAAGGAVYSVCGFALWILAGRPRGAERHLFGAITMALKDISQTLYRVRAAHGEIPVRAGASRSGMTVDAVGVLRLRAGEA